MGKVKGDFKNESPTQGEAPGRRSDSVRVGVVGPLDSGGPIVRDYFFALASARRVL